MFIEFVKGKGNKRLPKGFKPYLRRWFYSKFEELTPPQRYSFKLILKRENVLIASPTGSGKTLAGFLAILNFLFDLAERKELKNKVYCVYVSPLRALNNDVRRNLEEPLREIREIAEKDFRKELEEIRIGLRTSDTKGSEKSRHLKKVPHILITTPESLAIILNAPKFREALKGVEFVIVDEIHELASSKRGVHLSLSLERLVNIAGKEFTRIGLGATLYPLEEAAKFLVGNNRKCKIIDVSWEKPYDIKVETPLKNLVWARAEEINHALYEKLDNFIREHKTTLIFTNTRSGTERVVFHLKERWKDRYENLDKDFELIGAHHSSLSRELRLGIEERLKKGLLRAVVCSTSLELGVDIGYIDLVVQIGSPKSITRAIQRIGRAGHKYKDVAKGRVLVLDRDDLVECSVMLKCALERKLDKFSIPKNCLDVLAQHLLGLALTKKWKAEEAFNLVRKSYCYKDLSWEDFEKVLEYLSGYYVELEDRKVYGKIWYDKEKKEFGKRGKYARVIYYLNLGTIPDEVKIDVFSYPKFKYIGSIEEDFLERLKRGDIFVLGGKTYRFLFARSLRAYVQEVKEALPTIPNWFSETLPLSFDLAREIRKFREKLSEKMGKEKKEKVIEWIAKEYPLGKTEATNIYNYFWEQFKFALIPKENEILIEDTRDLEKRRFIVFHALFGRRVNDALSRAFAFILSNKYSCDIAITISDNGFAFHLPYSYEIEFEEVLEELGKENLEELLKKNIRRAEIMKRRFRHNATRSFLVLRNYKGYKISVSRQQLSAQTLLNICEKIDPDFPVIKETYREILYDVMDLENAKKVVEGLKKGRIKVRVIKTKVPSPFAHNLIVMGEPDIILMEDRKKRLIKLWEEVMKEIKRK